LFVVPQKVLSFSDRNPGSATGPGHATVKNGNICITTEHAQHNIVTEEIS